MMKTKLTLFVTVLAAALFLGGCASPLDKGLVAYYPFNGNAKDESGNGNDGQVKGATLARDRHLNVDAAYEFSCVKSSYIDIRESNTLKPQKMTLNAWVYLSKEATDEPWDIVYKDHSFQWVIDNTGKGGAKNFFGINKGAVAKWANVEYQGRIPAEEWFMYTATYDGVALKQYLNSEEMCSLRFSEPVPYGVRFKKSSLIIGWESRRTAIRNNVTSKFDDVRIYNRALSADEVKALYDLEKPKSK